MERQEGRKEGREGTEKGEWKGAVPTKPPPSSDTSPGRGKEGKWRRRIGGRGEREGKNGRAGREGRREGRERAGYTMPCVKEVRERRTAWERTKGKTTIVSHEKSGRKIKLSKHIQRKLHIN
jgi:hypothetical protein